MSFKIYLKLVQDILTHLALMKASYPALLIVKCLALHLGLQMESHLVFMKEMSWALQMAPLVVLMKANLTVSCFGLNSDKKLVILLEIKMAYLREQHSESHLVHLMDLCLALMNTQLY